MKYLKKVQKLQQKLFDKMRVQVRVEKNVYHDGTGEDKEENSILFVFENEEGLMEVLPITLVVSEELAMRDYERICDRLRTMGYDV